MSDECEVDEFIIFYIKSRIEFDNKFKWFDAPCIRDCLVCEKCLIVESAAIMFEENNISQLKESLTKLIDLNRLTYKSYLCIFDAYINLLSERAKTRRQQNETEISELCIPLLAIISFTGVYARRLVELDYSVNSIPTSLAKEEMDNIFINRRDYRRELYQLSIFASKMFQKKLNDFGDLYGYSWEMFVNETSIWIEDLKKLKEIEKKHLIESVKNRNLFFTVLAATAAVAAIVFYNQNHFRFGINFQL